MANPVRQAVKVVTDSTADMPAEMTRRLGVEVVPLMVLMGNETFRDGIDISAHEFYQRLSHENKLPTTSQPSPGMFMEAYHKATEDGSAVISIHISSKLSGTYENALVAARNFPNGQVRVVDTRQVSAGIALFVQTAAEMARNGYDVETIETQLNNLTRTSQADSDGRYSRIFAQGWAHWRYGKLFRFAFECQTALAVERW